MVQYLIIWRSGDAEKHMKIFTTDSDTEVVMFIYMGRKLLEKFDKWMIVFYNKVESTIIIARDKLGIKPLYYFLDKDKLIFSSEIKPKKKHVWLKKNLIKK